MKRFWITLGLGCVLYIGGQWNLEPVSDRQVFTGIFPIYLSGVFIYIAFDGLDKWMEKQNGKRTA